MNPPGSNSTGVSSGNDPYHTDPAYFQALDLMGAIAQRDFDEKEGNLCGDYLDGDVRLGGRCRPEDLWDLAAYTLYGAGQVADGVGLLAGGCATLFAALAQPEVAAPCAAVDKGADVASIGIGTLEMAIAPMTSSPCTYYTDGAINIASGAFGLSMGGALDPFVNTYWSQIALAGSTFYVDLVLVVLDPSADTC